MEDCEVRKEGWGDASEGRTARGGFCLLVPVEVPVKGRLQCCFEHGQRGVVIIRRPATVIGANVNRLKSKLFKY